MKKIDPNYFAFATPGSEDRTGGDMPDGNVFVEGQRGLTIRAYFAASAMTGFAALPNQDGDGFSIDRVVKWSVEAADLLIAALNEVPK